MTKFLVEISPGIWKVNLVKLGSRLKWEEW